MRGRGRSYGRGSHGASSLAADESPQPNPDQQQQPNPDQQQVALEPRVEGGKTTVEPNVAGYVWKLTYIITTLYNI